MKNKLDFLTMDLLSAFIVKHVLEVMRYFAFLLMMLLLWQMFLYNS